MSGEQNRPTFDNICPSSREEVVRPVRAVLHNFTAFDTEQLDNAMRYFNKN